MLVLVDINVKFTPAPSGRKHCICRLFAIRRRISDFKYLRYMVIREYTTCVTRRCKGKCGHTMENGLKVNLTTKLQIKRLNGYIHGFKHEKSFEKMEFSLDN